MENKATRRCKMFDCHYCKRRCDIMIDGCHELNNLSEICDKCMYDEWTEGDLIECKAALQESINECGCSGGCWWCLDVEVRSFR
jgi:hypothetical protein